ncbi:MULTISPECIES: tagaturonate reductase [unclassified Spirosoma]|uniref:tagaturonate reductase n=1 Tax=unclassified Spirosoma TaxID=2621999 RepID=UPI000959CEBB|nr:MULTISPECIES: tagaturonate reductase [unclassified Spirosoma]MBN8820938.1 tagaturonate reductase [Spirosoma sp.]OJW75949.1 MAG: altronate oxidoreductase [Spirosoma sp. 48-14]
MQPLSVQSLPTIQSQLALTRPLPNHQQLPERVLQFGTGVLLRGLPDYFIDKANRQGIFNGRIVVVKSTDGGDMTAFARQDNLYTLCIRGVENRELVEQNIVCSAISRVLSAKQQWSEVLQVATSPDLQIVLSNTTEVGIQLVQDDIRQSPPESFPGKLLAVLYARYKAFNGDPTKGLVIVPTELIPDNGTKLEAILLELAHRNALEGAFIDWLESANTCCNSLVDRIVPGRPDPATQHALTEQLGYEDDLLTISEVYRLWAIEGDEQVQNVLSFHKADENIFIRPNIDLFRELKLRLLNGTHTLSCGLAFLSGFDTVREAMEDEILSAFISGVMLGELIPGIPYPVDEKAAQRFGFQVLDRFRNPFIEHRWLAITMQYSAKMQMRNIPTLLHYYKQLDVTPRYITLGFAAYLLFMKATIQENEVWYGEREGVKYPIYDAQAGYFADLWARLSPEELTTTVLQNTALWGHDLTLLAGFADSVSHYLVQMIETGVFSTVSSQFDHLETITK